MVGRWLSVLIAVACLGAAVSSCGKRGELTRPEPASYPRQYPPQS